MHIETQFSVGDRVQYTGRASEHHSKEPGDTGVIEGVHIHVGESRAEISYSVRIDDEFVPRLEAAGCGIRIFHLYENELAACG